MPFDEVPSFIAELRKRQATAALALEFTILTAARTSETLGAIWSEIDLKKGLWAIPAGRMKAGREHRVPLVGRASEILSACLLARQSDHVFPGQRPGKPLSNMSMEMLLRRMGQTSVTTHGFRSSFRDWAGEQTAFPREVAEAALAHQVGDETERAYRRGDALEKRRAMMTVWADYLELHEQDPAVQTTQPAASPPVTAKDSQSPVLGVFSLASANNTSFVIVLKRHESHASALTLS